MKEEKTDCLDFEEVKTNSSPDASPSMESKLEETVSQKRSCSPDDRDERPLKIRRLSSPPCDQTKPSTDHGDECLIPTSHKKLFSCTDAVPGCSKDYIYSETQPSSHETPHLTEIKEVSINLDDDSSNQEALDDCTQAVELMNLSDDVLLIIMSNLKPTDLLNLSSLVPLLLHLCLNLF